jgi:hypothetical protein
MRISGQQSMSTSFFIEFRLQGFAKQYAKWVNSRVYREGRRLGIRTLKERRFVSHIALFGPARTNHLRRVIAEVERTCQKYPPVPFKVGGFDSFRNPDANWLYLDVKPSYALEQLRHKLAQNLIGSERMIHDTCRSFDHRSLGNMLQEMASNLKGCSTLLKPNAAWKLSGSIGCLCLAGFSTSLRNTSSG